MKKNSKYLVISNSVFFKDSLLRFLTTNKKIKPFNIDVSSVEQFKSFKHTKYDMLFLNLDSYEKQEIHIINSFLVSNSELKIVVITHLSGKKYSEHLMRDGVKGFLDQNCDFDELSLCIDKISSNEIYLNDELKNHIIHKMAHGNGNGNGNGNGKNDLTKKEKEVINCFALGKSSKECALELDCSPKTINVHRANINAKLNFKNTNQFMNFAYNHINYQLDGHLID